MKTYRNLLRSKGFTFIDITVAGLLSVAIALLTVGYQRVKAALTNPARNLRME